MDINKGYLIFAFSAVSAIGLLYGVMPEWFARTFIGVQMLDANSAHIFGAVMGLDLALGYFWLYAACDAPPEHCLTPPESCPTDRLFARADHRVTF